MNDLALDGISKCNDKQLIKDFIKKNGGMTVRNSQNQNILHLVAMHGTLDTMRFLLKKKYLVYEDKKISIDICDKEGYTPLLCAINQGRFDISEKLISKGANPNARTSSGSTPLHLLTKYCYDPKSIKLANILIEAGGYINHKDSKFETPLHRATLHQDNIEFIRLLLRNGANPNIVNKRGRTCQHIAIEDGRLDVLELFLYYGATFHTTVSQIPSPLECGLASNKVQIQNFFSERIGLNGENILAVEKNVMLGKSVPTLVHSGDGISTSYHIQLFPGRLFVTNYRIVFNFNNQNNQNSNNQNCLNSPNVSTIINNNSSNSNMNNSNSTGTETSSSSGGSISRGSSSSTATGLGILTSLSIPGFSSNSGTTPNSKTKDFKQVRFYTISSFQKDRIIDIINLHYKVKIEKALKMNQANRSIQKKIVEENIHLEEESRMEHIDRYESYGIFEEQIPYLYAFVHRSISPSGSPLTASMIDKDGWSIYSPRLEYGRFGIMEDSVNNRGGTLNQNLYWKFTSINKDYKMCSSYPSTFVVPRVMLDRDLEKVFSFRSKGRIPVLSWKDPNGYASINRCSQPLVGISATRCQEDETYCENIAANSTNKQLYLLDARPKLNAMANTANGAGFENINNYNNCKLVFMNIPNIHVMRKSLEKLVTSLNNCSLENDSQRWWSSIEESGWMTHIKGVLSASLFAADLISKNISVLVHCSDGWDRTPQITSLAQIMLDPFYRTIIGLEVLIEKEWLSFGHKFSLRLGHLHESEEERSPIFQQFLDAVFQLVNQFPLLFEYTPTLLLFISEHLFSCKYGTFLHNCEKDRVQDQTKTKTVSIWTDVNSNISTFSNPFYQSNQDRIVLKPNLHMRCLELWKACYMKSDSKNTWLHNIWMVQSHHQLLNLSQHHQLNDHHTSNSTTPLITSSNSISSNISSPPSSPFNNKIPIISITPDINTNSKSSISSPELKEILINNDINNENSSKLKEKSTFKFRGHRKSQSTSNILSFNHFNEQQQQSDIEEQKISLSPPNKNKLSLSSDSLKKNNSTTNNNNNNTKGSTISSSSSFFIYKSEFKQSNTKKMLVGSHRPISISDESCNIKSKNSPSPPNGAGPYRNPHQTYTFDSLPWCFSSFGKKRMSLADSLLGNDIVNSGIPIMFGKSFPTQNICNMTIDERAKLKFIDAIKNDFIHQMYIDGLPIFVKIGEFTSPDFYLYTHKKFIISHNGNKIVSVNIITEKPVKIEIDKQIEFEYSAVCSGGGSGDHGDPEEEFLKPGNDSIGWKQIHSDLDLHGSLEIMY
eukprot:gene7916-9742_t